MLGDAIITSTIAIFIDMKMFTQWTFDIQLWVNLVALLLPVQTLYLSPDAHEILFNNKKNVGI